MSALSDVSDAVLAALASAPDLAALNRVGTGEGERSPPPYALLNEGVASDWGAKMPPGREVTLTLSLIDAGPGERLAALAEAAEAALLALPRPVGDWDHAGARLRRTRAIQRRDGTREVRIEVRLRLLALV
jgi:hypothetical protein